MADFSDFSYYSCMVWTIWIFLKIQFVFVFNTFIISLLELNSQQFIEHTQVCSLQSFDIIEIEFWVNLTLQAFFCLEKVSLTGQCQSSIPTIVI